MALSVDDVSSAKQYVPSPGMAAVTSKSTVCPCATAPSVASAGPSIAGRVVQVMVRSFQPHPVIAGSVALVVVDVVVVIVGPAPHGQTAVTATSGFPAVASREL